MNATSADIGNSAIENESDRRFGMQDTHPHDVPPPLLALTLDTVDC
jgi:hypothetical protein